MLGALDNASPDSAERIRSLMFTFEDLGKLMPSAIAAIVRVADKRQMALALKGAEAGVQLLRVHDVPETVQALKVWRGLRDQALTRPERTHV